MSLSPEGHCDLLLPEVDIIVQRQNSFCLNISEWEEAIVQTVSLTTHHLRGCAGRVGVAWVWHTWVYAKGKSNY